MRILAVLLVLPLTSLAQGMLIVPADDVARSVVDGMIEPLSKSGLAFKTAGGRAPAMACFKEQEATRQHACLLRIASDANVLGVLLVRGASAKRVVDASFEVLEVASQGATFREKLRSPEPKLARATAMLLKRLLPALLHLKPALPPPPPPADPPGDPAPLARNDPGPPPATATPRPPPPALAGASDVPRRPQEQPSRPSLVPRPAPPDVTVTRLDAAPNRSRVGAWAFTGLAVAAAAGAATFAVLGLSGKSKLETSTDGVAGLSYRDASTLQRQANQQLGISLGAGIGALVTGGIAGVLWSQSP